MDAKGYGTSLWLLLTHMCHLNAGSCGCLHFLCVIIRNCWVISKISDKYEWNSDGGHDLTVLFLGSTPRGGRGVFHFCALWQYTCLMLLPTVRWRYRRHVAQLCCWRLATLTGRGGGGVGGDDNVPFDCKMTLPKTRCPTLLGSFTTYIYQNACFYIHVCLHVFIYIYIYVCKGYLKYLCIHVSSRCCGIAIFFLAFWHLAANVKTS